MRSWNLEFQLLHLYIEKSTFPNKKSWMAELAKAPVFYHAEGCGFDPHDRGMPFLLYFCPECTRRHIMYCSFFPFLGYCVIPESWALTKIFSILQRALLLLYFLNSYFADSYHVENFTKKEINGWGHRNVNCTHSTCLNLGS